MRRIVLNIAALLLAGSAATAQAAIHSPAPSDRDTIVVTARSFAPVSPNIFGTVALGAGVTVYGARWRRVSAADECDPRITALAVAAIAAGSDPAKRIAWVQSAVGQRIRSGRDLDIYHVSDYWAQAGETLTRGEGDSEDIAILKMQILKVAGFASRDIYLSLGRNTPLGPDARLLVRVGEQFYALDDHSPSPVNALYAQRFEPVITLGRNSAWLHGHRYAGRTSNTTIRRASFTRPIAR